MNKIVVNPNFINDERLNHKIEGILGMHAFQKMVDNADVFQDISNTSLSNKSEFLQKSKNDSLKSFKNLLPTHSQISKDEDPDELPRFGATEDNTTENIVMLEPQPDETDKNVERLLGSAPIQIKQPQPGSEDAKKEEEPNSPEPGDQPSQPMNDDSFSNLQMAAETETPTASK